MVKGVRRIVFGALSTATVVVLLFGYRTSTEGPETTATPAAIAPAVTSSDTTSDQASGSAGSDGTGSDGTGSGSTGSDGTGSGSTGSDGTGSDSAGSDSAGSDSAGTTTVTGDAEQTQWGPVQVELTITDGSITDVAVPVYPSGNGRDAEINSYALPQLVQETISAQSANIDMISGATVTSDGYVRSLQSALDKAGL